MREKSTRTSSLIEGSLWKIQKEQLQTNTVDEVYVNHTLPEKMRYNLKKLESYSFKR
jgi:hypothetical protein